MQIKLVYYITSYITDYVIIRFIILHITFDNFFYIINKNLYINFFNLSL